MMVISPQANHSVCAEREQHTGRQQQPHRRLVIGGHVQVATEGMPLEEDDGRGVHSFPAQWRRAAELHLDARSSRIGVVSRAVAVAVTVPVAVTVVVAATVVAVRKFLLQLVFGFAVVEV